jgi:hypothetical protein
VPLLDELEALGLASNTIIALTADHGELDGAHRLHSKGRHRLPPAEQRSAHRRAPGVPRGKRCRAVTLDLDIAPTLVSLTNASSEKKATITSHLPGKDLSSLLAAPTPRPATARCIPTTCSPTLTASSWQRQSPPCISPTGSQAQTGCKGGDEAPGVSKRGAIRAPFDGRSRFARYFSPKQHDRPARRSRRSSN